MIFIFDNSVISKTLIWPYGHAESSTFELLISVFFFNKSSIILDINAYKHKHSYLEDNTYTCILTAKILFDTKLKSGSYLLLVTRL